MRTISLGSGGSNPHWFHITIFPVTAVNCLKIRQYSLHNLLCYRKNCLCETASTCSAEFLQRISVRKGAGGLTPVKTDKAEGFVKIQSTGNAGSGHHCLKVFVPRLFENLVDNRCNNNRDYHFRYHIAAVIHNGVYHREGSTLKR